MSENIGHHVADLIRLIDLSLSIVESARGDVFDCETGSSDGRGWLFENYGKLIADLRTLRDTVASGRMPRPSRGDVPIGTGLLLAKSTGAWCDNREVIDSLSSIDKYYRYSF